MGAKNAAAAAQLAGKMSAPAALTLVIMALKSLDEQRGRKPARTYWGGHAAIVEAFGLDATPSRLRHVREQILELKRHGYVEPAGYIGRRRIYLLHLPAPVDNPVHNALPP